MNEATEIYILKNALPIWKVFSQPTIFPLMLRMFPVVKVQLSRFLRSSAQPMPVSSIPYSTGAVTSTPNVW